MCNSFVVPVSHRIGVEHQQSVIALHVCQTETDILGRDAPSLLSHALNPISYILLHQQGLPGDNAQPADWTGSELPVSRPHLTGAFGSPGRATMSHGINNIYRYRYSTGSYIQDQQFGYLQTNCLSNSMS